MGIGCCSSGCSVEGAVGAGFRKALWIALIVNATMFGVEVIGGLHAGSVSLLADAVDFAGDAANYGISLAVLAMGLRWRSRAALVKGLSMTLFGLFVIVRTVWATLAGEPPEPLTMGLIAGLALSSGLAVVRHARAELRRPSLEAVVKAPGADSRRPPIAVVQSSTMADHRNARSR